MNLFFKFKQFTIYQDKAGMKVTTDSVLLGAWAECSEAQEILDIGTGTGILALMCAQKNKKAKIYAIEKHYLSYLQAKENFVRSKWSNRLFPIHADFVTYDFKEQKFDCIISNPPYFPNSLLPQKKEFRTAKHTVELNYNVLCAKVSNILKKNGAFYLIIPFDLHNKFMQICNVHFLFCSDKVFIKTSNNKAPNRVLMRFVPKVEMCRTSTLTIKHDNDYTKEYKKLTSDFYLYF